MKKTTIVDIAKELDLSPSTVSRALNGIGRMNDETREEILKLAKEWGYHPNPHAQRLKKSKTSTIGLIVPELTHHFYSQIIKGVDSVLDAYGYQQIICMSNEEFEKEQKAALTLLNARVDGLLVALSNETKEYDHIQQLIDATGAYEFHGSARVSANNPVLYSNPAVADSGNMFVADLQEIQKMVAVLERRNEGKLG